MYYSLPGWDTSVLLTCTPFTPQAVTLVHVRSDMTWKSALAKKLSVSEIAAINAVMGAQSGDVLVLSAGPFDQTGCVDCVTHRCWSYCYG